VSAFILPRAWLGIVLIALIPLEFYFPITASFYLRGALVFVLAAMLARRHLSSFVLRLSSFVLRPPSSVLASPRRALPCRRVHRCARCKRIATPRSRASTTTCRFFAAAFVIGETMRPQWLKRFLIALVTVGVLEALLGLIQTRFTPTQISEMLQVGVSEWFYQPNLLRERFADFSFNWILENRVLPFGTFINGIDYALFLAAMVGLVSAWWLETLTADRRPPTAASSLSTDAHSVGITYHVSRIAYHTFWLIGSLAHWLIGSLAHWLIPTICLSAHWHCLVADVQRIGLVGAGRRRCSASCGKLGAKYAPLPPASCLLPTGY
jgi:hypothetical protein